MPNIFHIFAALNKKNNKMETYIKPYTEIITLTSEDSMLTKASSIQNSEGDVQTPIEKNDEDDFECGSKPFHNYGAWN